MRTYEIVTDNVHSLVVLSEIRTVELTQHTTYDTKSGRNIPVVGKSLLLIYWRNISNYRGSYVLSDKYAAQVFEDIKIMLNKTEQVAV